MVPYPGCERNGILDLRCGTGLQYFLTAWVKHATKITLSAPNAVRHGAWFTVSGRLTGTTGAVVLDRSWDGTHWSTFALKHVGSNGRFSVRTRLGRAGTVQIKASFPEAPLFAASSATIAVRAV